MLTDEQRADGWIEHDGGPCPVALDSRPGVMFTKGGTIEPGEFYASFWFWKPKIFVDGGIIAYRPETPND